ncbi:MAG: PKD domain-containing protein, partial [Candidatus Thermoplasmatota archaeon]|nr:PKD domain-containing protein [Candidatus Thermoplasmatota archaeon]
CDTAPRRPHLSRGSCVLRQFMIVSIIAWFVFSSFSVMLRVPPPQDSPSFEPLQRADSLNVENANITFSASPSYVYVNESVTFFANATSDVPAAALTFRIYFDGYTLPGLSNNTASATSVNTTGNPGSIVVNYTYNAPGNYSDANGKYFRVRLFVGDGTNTVEYPHIRVHVNYNTAPSILGSVPNPLQTMKDTEVSLSTSIQDVNNDSVTVTWDFGDDTANETQVLTGTSATGGVYSNVTHTWSPPLDPAHIGDFYATYQMNITLDDGFNLPVVSTSSVIVYVPFDYPPTIGFAASVSRASPGDVINFSANATDPEGDPLTWTFNYSDGKIEVFHTPATSPSTLAWNNVTHVFDAVGNYTVFVYVSDALEPYQVSLHNQSAKIKIQIVDNLPPSASSEIGSSPQGDPQIEGKIGNISVEFSIEGNDPDGDVVTAVWNMDDTLGPRTNATPGGTGKFMFNQTRIFDKPGLYNISIVITDGRPGHEILRYRIVNVTSTNLPPNLVSLDFQYAPGLDYAEPNETITFILVLSDPERDSIEVSWDFGDGTPIQYFNLTEYVDGNLTLTLNHSYPEVKEYTITVHYTDNQQGILNHFKFTNATVVVFLPKAATVIMWDLWDFVSLGLFSLIPVSLVARALYVARRRKRFEKEGVTLEEYNLMKQEHVDQLDQDRKEG